MILHFSKCLSLLICSSSIRIKFKLLYIILVVVAVEVSLYTIPSAAAKSYSSTSAFSSSGHFDFLYFHRSVLIYIKLRSTILVIFIRLFCRVCYVFFVTLILSILSCRFSLSRLINFLNCCELFFVYVELEITRF